MEREKMITFKLEDEERKVVVATDNDWITLEELFMLWVDFAAGCGYTIDRIHMQEVWDGIDADPKELKQ